MDTNELYRQYVEIIENELVSYDTDKLMLLTNKINQIIKKSPANGYLHQVNCFVGGYLSATMEYYYNSIKYFDLLTDIGLDIDFTLEDLKFCVLFHNIGSITDGEFSRYIVNSSEWHIRNQGKKYIHNPKVKFMLDRDRSLFILQKNSILLNDDVYLSIYLKDWDLIDSNKHYIHNLDDSMRLRCKLPHVLNLILNSTNLKLLQTNNLENEQLESAYDVDKKKMKVYNRTKKVKQSLSLDINIGDI